MKGELKLNFFKRNVSKFYDKLSVRHHLSNRFKKKNSNKFYTEFYYGVLEKNVKKKIMTWLHFDAIKNVLVCFVIKR